MRSAVLTIWLGIVAWAIALVIEIAINAKASHIWTCLIGLALGVTQSEEPKERTGINLRSDRRYRAEL